MATLAPTLDRRPARPLWQAGLLAVALAAGVNALLFLIAQALGAFPSDVLLPRAGQPMTLTPIVVVSAVAALLGWAVFALLRRLTRHAVPVFVALAVVALALMAIPPFQIVGAPVAMIVWLQVLHVTTAVITLFVLLRAARS